MPKDGVYSPEEKALLDEYALGGVATKPAGVTLWSHTTMDEPMAEGANVKIRTQAGIRRADDTGREREFTVIPTFPKIGVDLPLRLWSIDEGFAQVLTGLVTAIKPKVCLEIGTNWGRSARAIAEGLVLNGDGHLTTVDMIDHEIHTSGALLENQKAFVSQIIGRTPEVYGEPFLANMKGIDFAFLDGEHKAKGVEEDLNFVDEHRTENCLVLVDNADDPNWPEMGEFFGSYTKYPHICLNTMCGTRMIWMKD